MSMLYDHEDLDPYCSSSSISAFSAHLASPSPIPLPRFASLFFGFARLRPSVVLSSIRFDLGPLPRPSSSLLPLLFHDHRLRVSSFAFRASILSDPDPDFLPPLLDPICSFLFSSSLGVGRQGVMSFWVDEFPSLLPTPTPSIHLHP